MIREITPVIITIKNGQTTSNPFYVGNLVAVGIIFPAAMDGATLAIEVSHHPTAFFVPLDGTNTSFSNPVAIVPGKAFEIMSGLNPFPFPFARLVSNIAQTADRALIITGKG